MEENRCQRITKSPSVKEHLDSECEWIFGGKAKKEKCGAYGVFTVTNNLTKYTKAALFDQTGKKTHVFLTFSEVDECMEDQSIGRCVCICSIRFHTKDGIWDLVGCNHPVSFTCHPQIYHNYISSKRLSVENNRLNLVEKWTAWSALPDSLHQIMFLMGDRGIPRDYRHMHSFGCLTYRFINNKNQRFLGKFHLLTQQGILNFTRREALKIDIGRYRFAQRDLYDNIKRGNYPKWRMYLQLMPEEDADKCTFDPYDPTKVWPHNKYPLIEAGILELHRNLENDSVEVHCSNLCPFNLIPGIEIPQFRNINHNKSDHYLQPGIFFRLQCIEAQQRFIHNIIVELALVPEYIRIRAIARFYQADEYCGKEIAKKLQMEMKFILKEIEWQKKMEMKIVY